MKTGLIYQFRMLAVVSLLEVALWLAPKENKQQGKLAKTLLPYFKEQLWEEWNRG